MDVEDLIKSGQIEMSMESVYNIWNRIQEICGTALQQTISKLGANSKVVEVGSVRVGQFYVVGAKELTTCRCRLGIVPVSSLKGPNSKSTFVHMVVQWVISKANIKTAEAKFMALSSLGFRVMLVPKAEFLANVTKYASIAGYLTQNMERLFKDIDLSTLTEHFLVSVLREFEWREVFGTEPLFAFNNIIKHISVQCKLASMKEKLVKKSPAPYTVLKKRV